MNRLSGMKLALLGRSLAAIFGGYAFTWGFIALSISSLLTQGMPFGDAEHMSAIVGIFLYLAVFLWAIAARSLLQVWLALAGGGALMTGAASLVQHLLL